MSEKEMRELDAWIAEHVMGWQKLKKPFNITAATFFHAGGGSEVLVHHQANQLKCFHPTTDRAAAMEVLEKCAEKCGTIKIVNIGLMWWVNDNQKSCEGKADTLPLAICKFAKELYEKQT